MEEISFKELVGILYKHRRLVIGIIITSVLISAVYSFIIAEPTYQAQVQIGITEIVTGVSSIDKTNEAGAMIDTLLGWLSDSQFLEKVNKELKNNNISIDQSAMKSIISARKGNGEKTIILSTSYKDKKAVAHIVNITAEALANGASDYSKEQIQQQLAITEEQIKLVKVNSEDALAKYKEYAVSPESSNKLQSEININEPLLVQLKTSLITGDIGPGKSKKQLELDIKKLEEETRVLNEKLVEAYSHDRLLKEELDSSLDIYKSFNDEYNRLKFAEIYSKDKPNVNILSYAAEPQAASWPNRKGIIIISLFASMCIGVLAAITIEYFKHEK